MTKPPTFPAERYRKAAELLNEYASRCRAEGDTREAEQAELAAADWTATAEWAELAEGGRTDD